MSIGDVKRTDDIHMTGHKKKIYCCPAELTLDQMGSKWGVILLWNLRKERLSFNLLKKKTPGISASNLSLNLKRLIQAGLVVRHPSALPRGEVFYSMSEKGKSLDSILKSLVRWGSNTNTNMRKANS